MDYRQRLTESAARHRSLVLERLAGSPARGRAPAPSAPPGVRPQAMLRQRVFRRLLQTVESEGASVLDDERELRERVGRILDEELGRPGAPALRPRERSQIESEVLAEVGGLGPIDPLFADPTVSDILVNGAGEVWVDRFGKLERTTLYFDDSEHLRRLLGRWVSRQGRHLDEASPMVDVRLADGSRLHAVIPPLSAEPVVSIRRMRSMPFRLDELVENETLSDAMATLLRAAVASGLNIAISGGAASGKTTLLNVLSSFIPREERVVTIEETAELRLDHPHVIALEARLPNIEGRGEVTLRSLVRNSLRMRADRIIVGEVRGPEVFDMLQAMNTGHEGSLTTVHANSPADAIRRLENLVHLGGFSLTSDAVRELLGAAFDLVVHLTRFTDGNRRITSICETLADGRDVEMRELFRYRTGDARKPGGHQACGVVPNFLDRLAGDEPIGKEIFRDG